MPDWRISRVSIPVGPLSAAVALAALLALAPAAHPTHAQVGPDPGPPGPGMAPPLPPPPIPGVPGYATIFGELVVAGQTQVCQESLQAEANYSAYYGPPYGTVPGPLWGFPWYAHTNLVPYGGFWGFYGGSKSPVCLWQPR
jgi:hypothetical protein